MDFGRSRCSMRTLFLMFYIGRRPRMLESAVLRRNGGASLVWQPDCLSSRKLFCPCPELAIDIVVSVQRLSRLPQRYTMMLLEGFDRWLCLCKLYVVLVWGWQSSSLSAGSG